MVPQPSPGHFVYPFSPKFGWERLHDMVCTTDDAVVTSSPAPQLSHLSSSCSRLLFRRPAVLNIERVINHACNLLFSISLRIYSLVRLRLNTPTVLFERLGRVVGSANHPTTAVALEVHSLR
jgi:hypothetical protein